MTFIVKNIGAYFEVTTKARCSPIGLKLDEWALLMQVNIQSHGN